MLCVAESAPKAHLICQNAACLADVFGSHDTAVHEFHTLPLVRSQVPACLHSEPLYDATRIKRDCTEEES